MTAASSTSGRLLTLLSLLQTPREWPGPELARRLDVSTRTVRNDVERLRSLGYPVQATRGAVGGYRLAAGTAMPPLLLDDDEAVAVAVSLRTTAGGGVDGIEETALRAMTKLQQVLPQRLARRVEAVQSFTVRGTPTGRGQRVDWSVLDLLAAAARDHEIVRFAYSDRDGAATERRVEPYRLVNVGRRWYLVAHDVERDDWRMFRLDRMTGQRSAGHRFRPRELPADDIAEWVRTRTRGSSPFRATVVAHAPAADIAQAMGAWSEGTIEPVGDDRCRATFGARSAEDMALWLSFLRCEFDVVDPPELRAALAALGARLTRAAQAG